VATSYLHPQEEERQNPEEKKEAEEDAGGVKDLWRRGVMCREEIRRGHIAHKKIHFRPLTSVIQGHTLL